MPKITTDCKKVLKKLEKTKPRITKQISKKLKEFHYNGVGKNGSLGVIGDCKAHKLYLTTPFGDFRLIVVNNALVDILLIEVYAKNTKKDLTQEECKQIKPVLLACQSKEFWQNLEDLEQLLFNLD